MRILSVVILVCVAQVISAQNARNYIKAAEQFIENGYYEDAIDQFTKALDLEPENGKIYEDRAVNYYRLQKFKLAAEDYKKAAVFKNNPAENFLQAAAIYYKLGNFKEAISLTEKSLQADTKYDEALILQARAYISLEEFDKALVSATAAANAKATAYALYLKGLCEFKLNNIELAEQDLEKSIIKDKNLFDAYLVLAELQLSIAKTNYSLENSSFVIMNDRRNARAYALRSMAYNKLDQQAKAIQDISNAISIDSSTIDYLVLRGSYYLEFTQYHEAITDFTIALGYDMINREALSKRALAYEKIHENKKASSDYSLLLSLYDDAEYENIAAISKKIYELNRETEGPQITLHNNLLSEKQELQISSDLQIIEIEAAIADASKLKFIRVNNDTLVNTAEGVTKKNFSHLMNTADLEFLTISVVDIYDNSTTLSYPVERIETHKPRINLMNPYVGDDGIIVLNTDDKYLYLEGRIEDESLISSIRIDEVTASYAPRDMNPRFTATLDVSKKNRIRVQAKDIYGNTVETEYLFRRDGKVLSDDSPMGKTWVVLIENSEYKSFANLATPEKDLRLMQQALDRYKIDKVIVKSNLTKREMERFFSIDLRDLVRINQVNSLFIWFAGHGKNENGIGYWIPSDAQMDAEFTYFNINALKASLYSYTSLTHLLVVSDACETGPAFCEALRGPIEGVNCSQTNLSTQKSAQVLTSAGSGYAYDNSLFTRSFANTLLNNDDDCVSIDDIAKRVSIIVQNSSVQQPEFGRISGLNDEQGTFFFLTR